MRNGTPVVALVPARGGSKGVPGKNIKELGSKPLLAWAIEVAAATDGVDRTLVSTDDHEIASVAREWGAEVSMRPAHLATDDALVVDTVRHTVEELQSAADPPGYVVMLEPTTPFRRPEDVEACLDRLVETDVDSVATFTDAEVNPHRTWELSDGEPEPFLPEGTPWHPRQALPETYQLNGAVYAFDIDAVTDEGSSLLFGEAGAVTMPATRSLDIDTELDFAVAETLLEAGHVRD